MKQLLDKIYGIFSQLLSKWFILIGIACLAVYSFINLIGGLTQNSGEAFYYIMAFLFNITIVAGIAVGHYKNKEPILIIAFLAYLIILFSRRVVGSAAGTSVFEVANTAYILHWVFALIFGLALGCFLVCALLIYLFKLKGAKVILQASFLLAIIFGFIAEIFGIVSAANQNDWTTAITPLLEVGALLMIPAILEEVLPAELEETREEQAE